MGAVDARDGEDAVAGVFGDDGAHAATRRGQGHGDFDAVAVGGAFDGLDLEGIDEAEVDDVHRDLGVEDLLEAVPDGFVGGLAGVARMLGGADRAIGVGLAFVLGRIRRHLFAEGFGVGALDAEHARVADDCEVAAEAVRDGHLGASGQHGGFAGRDDGRLHVAP